MFLLSTKFENLEDERQLNFGTALIDFRVERGERIDSVLSRFEIARMEADSAGPHFPTFQMLTLLFFRALRVGPERASVLLHSPSRRMSRTQQQCESLVERMRSYVHMAERSP